MDQKPFDRHTCYSALREHERQQSFGNGVTPIWDSIGRPIASAMRSLTWQYEGVSGRVHRVDVALDQAKPIALQMMVQDFGSLKIDMIAPILLKILEDIALYVGGSVVTGAVVGGLLGSLAFGAGAAPGAVAGAWAGLEIGNLVMWFMGLKSVGEYMIDKIPQAFDFYVHGFREAWGPPPPRWEGDAICSPASLPQVGFAAQDIARGHVMMVYALLMGFVIYITRDKAGLAKLKAEIAGSAKLGPKVAEWLEQNAENLLKHPKLQKPVEKPAMPKAGAGGDAAAAAKPAPKPQPATPVKNGEGVSNAEAKTRQTNETMAKTGGALKGVGTARLAAEDYATKLRGTLSKSKIPRAASAAVDTATGDVYYGTSGTIAAAIHPDLTARIPSQSLEHWRVENCAEFNAVNNALYGGAKIEAIELHTVITKTGLPFPRCQNCQITTNGTHVTSDH